MGIELKVNAGTNEVYNWLLLQVENTNRLDGNTYDELVVRIKAANAEASDTEVQALIAELTERLQSVGALRVSAAERIMMTLDNKQDKEATRFLSTNDYTDKDKAQVMDFVELKQEIESFMRMILGK